MQVNFNNLRIKLVKSFNRMLTILEQDVTDKNKETLTQDFRTELNNIRECIVTLGCIEEKDNPDIRCILDNKLSVKEIEVDV